MSSISVSSIMGGNESVQRQAVFEKLEKNKINFVTREQLDKDIARYNSLQCGGGIAAGIGFGAAALYLIPLVVGKLGIFGVFVGVGATAGVVGSFVAISGLALEAAHLSEEIDQEEVALILNDVKEAAKAKRKQYKSEQSDAEKSIKKWTKIEQRIDTENYGYTPIR